MSVDPKAVTVDAARLEHEALELLKRNGLTSPTPRLKKKLIVDPIPPPKFLTDMEKGSKRKSGIWPFRNKDE